MYSTGTVTTTANSTKLVGTGTKWLNNINRVSAEQAIQIQINNTVYNNSIHSIQSDTELTLNFPLPIAATGAQYVILTTMVHSASDAMNKIVAMQVANVQFSDILTRWMTEQGIITVTLPDQTTQQLRTTKEMDKQLDGKVDKTTGEMESITVYKKGMNYPTLRLKKDDGSTLYLESKPDEQPVMAQLYERGPDGKIKYSISFPKSMGTAMQVGDFGVGSTSSRAVAIDFSNYRFKQGESVYATNASTNLPENLPAGYYRVTGMSGRDSGTEHSLFIFSDSPGGAAFYATSRNNRFIAREFYTTGNTTKDSNGNLKAASPVVKLFADNIELNEESEGVEMEHLGIGHYLIKGVVGFNADGAWGINNGFVIPQDHNGKNMVLIDYEVRPDGDIEVFVFHQQNADMPERFQNKRIKHFDEEGVPVYFENYEPCDIPESRWIDMRVEMPPNSLYNQKQAEAERLAKLEAERLAQEEAKRAAAEAERVEQEVE
ncbi:hypothetical protein VMZ82_002767 [Providencia rettgeri]|uniref:phage tail fiber protein n=1 Tax=Providencia rettgeri TaxID=587 RepID=UPI001EE74E6C|nr:hypothetical protein [Providencia rettgeri]EMC8779889.1 hypothetical protein [Providencia rettgeri]MCG5369069.1 hypothetical protein [Providencia rettgeri]